MKTKRSMTWKEFLDGLKSAEWALGEKGEITLKDDDGCCPWLFYTRQGGITARHDSDCQMIFNAADNAPGHSKRVRKALLKACGLREAR